MVYPERKGSIYSEDVNKKYQVRPVCGLRLLNNLQNLALRSNSGKLLNQKILDKCEGLMVCCEGVRLENHSRRKGVLCER